MKTKNLTSLLLARNGGVIAGVAAAAMSKALIVETKVFSQPLLY